MDDHIYANLNAYNNCTTIRCDNILMKYYYVGGNMVRYILKGNILDAIIEVISWDYEGNIVYFDMYIGMYGVF